MFVKVKGKSSMWHIFGETTYVSYLSSIGVDDPKSDPSLRSKLEAVDHYDKITNGSGPNNLLFFTSNGEGYALLFNTHAKVKSNSGETLEEVGSSSIENVTENSDNQENVFESNHGSFLDDLDNLFQKVNQKGGDKLKRRLQSLANLSESGRETGRGEVGEKEGTSDYDENFLETLRQNIDFMKEISDFVKNDDIMADSPESFESFEELDEWLEERGVKLEGELEHHQSFSDPSDTNYPIDENGETDEDTSRVEFDADRSTGAGRNPRRG